MESHHGDKHVWNVFLRAFSKWLHLLLLDKHVFKQNQLGDSSPYKTLCLLRQLSPYHIIIGFHNMQTVSSFSHQCWKANSLSTEQVELQNTLSSALESDCNSKFTVQNKPNQLQNSAKFKTTNLVQPNSKLATQFKTRTPTQNSKLYSTKLKLNQTQHSSLQHAGTIH